MRDMNTRCIKCSKPLLIGHICPCGKENAWKTKTEKKKEKK